MSNRNAGFWHFGAALLGITRHKSYSPRRTVVGTSVGYTSPKDALATCLLAVSASGAPQYTYSKAVQKACGNDYKRHCGQYGIETEALRLCMNKVGQRLTKNCVDALVASGEVSKQEVERRKRSAR